jgi:hypothetical protein
MQRFMGNKRPMDNIKIGLDEPQEDEYALIKILKDTPLEGMIFQNKSSFFLDNLQNISPKKKDKFKKSFIFYLKKLSLASNKQIVLKNPFHSFRIPIIQEMFPKAKYIHIYIEILLKLSHLLLICGISLEHKIY